MIRTNHAIYKQIECLSSSDQAAISHVWSLFAQAPADQRTLILKGLLSTCCMPQLSFLYDEIRPLLRIDFACILPREICLRIFSFLDAKSLCHAAQVSSLWKSLADDDTLWHRMCEQHIDRICTKCGWGLPLLDKIKKQGKRQDNNSSSASSGSPMAMDPIPPDTTTQSPNKRARFDISNNQQQQEMMMIDDDQDHEIHHHAKKRRPWKDVYSERLVVERNWRQNKHTVRHLSGHTDGVMCVQFCEASNIAITGSFDRTIRVWNLETGQEIRQLTGHTRGVRALQFDKCKLVSGAMDNTLKIWDWHTGRCIRTLEGHTAGVLSLHFDCRLLASGSADCTIRVWNFAAGECFSLTGHTEWINSVRICTYDQLLVSASDDATIRIWNLQSKTCVKVLNGHVGQVLCALPSTTRAFRHRLVSQSCSSTTTTTDHDDEPVIVSGAFDNTIKFWDFTGNCLRTLFGHLEGVWSLAFDSLRVVSGSHDRSVRVWDMESGKCMYALNGHTNPITAVAMSDTKIISASDDGDVRIWDFGMSQLQ